MQPPAMTCGAFIGAVAVLTLVLDLPAPDVSLADCDCENGPYLPPCSVQFADGLLLPQVTAFCTPAGTGTPLTEARAVSGATWDATIEVYVRDAVWDPCPDVPAEDVWLVATAAPELAPCPGGMIADAPTDADGRTVFSQPLRTGGYTDPAASLLHVVVRGTVIDGPGLDLQLNGADIDGDGRVNLTDVTIFALDFYGSYHFRSDFAWDGVLNLSDLGRLAGAVSSHCE